MSDAASEFDPYLHDPARWGVSMAQFSELMLPCLDAAGVRSIAEVGAFAGDLTRLLVAWAAGAEVKVLAIDPAPQPGLEQLAAEHPELTLIRETSLDALPRIELPDAIVIDGDHNYHTVSEELRLIAERSGPGQLPLLLFHDVCWPHGRRDDYFDPEQIPADARHPIAPPGSGIAPGDAGVRADGLPYPRSAAHEGGPRNGVLSAVEDFVRAHGGVSLAVIPAFFGFALAWERERPWSDAVASIVGPLDRHPLLERLEANRVARLASDYAHQTEIWALQAQLTRQRAVLERLLHSSAFAVAERLSKLRAGVGIAADQSVVSKSEIRSAIGD